MRAFHLSDKGVAHPTDGPGLAQCDRNAYARGPEGERSPWPFVSYDRAGHHRALSMRPAVHTDESYVCVAPATAVRCRRRGDVQPLPTPLGVSPPCMPIHGGA